MEDFQQIIFTILKPHEHMLSKRFASLDLTPSVVGLLLACRTVRASFLSSCRHLKSPVPASSVVHLEQFRALSCLYSSISKDFRSPFTAQCVHARNIASIVCTMCLLSVLCIYCWYYVFILFT
jgi:hypothetical protein